MTSREDILNKLRSSTKQAFPPTQSAPEKYLPVTQMGEDSLVSRFTAELERLSGKVYVVEGTQSVIDAVMQIVGEDSSVLAWDNPLIPSLYEALSWKDISVIAAKVRGNDRAGTLQTLASIRVGITGADAAFAATGTLAMVAEKRQARIPSLLPPVHVVLLPRDRLYPTMEEWLKQAGSQTLLNSRSLTFITGPSRTSDIEMQIILGVHGPREIHVIIY